MTTIRYNRKARLLFLAGLCIITACGSGFSFRPTSSFNIVDSALHDFDTINIIYCSGGPQENNGSFYYHLIAERAGDKKRVNVLVDDISSLQKDDPRKVFVSSTSDGYRIAIYEKAHPSDLSIANLKDFPPVKLRGNVVIGKENDAMAANNDYPSVIGSLAETSVPEDVKNNLDNLLPDSQKLH